MSFFTSPAGAAAISGGAELLGGIFGKDSGYHERKFAKEMSDRDYKRNLKMFWQNWTNQRYAAGNFTGMQMQDAMDTAAANGIHRLAAMGVQGPGYQPAGQLSQSEIPQGTYDNDGGPNIGDAVSRALNSAVNAYEFKHKKRMDEASLDLLKAQTKTTEARARAVEQNTADKRRAPLEDELAGWRQEKVVLPRKAKSEGGSQINTMGEDIGEMPVQALYTVLLGLKDLGLSIKQTAKFRKKLNAKIREERRKKPRTHTATPRELGGR